jgi:coenzyme F420-0:L-glutamate ligase/coenzyme F420-1:gamma-L-glutamate ligase
VEPGDDLAVMIGDALVRCGEVPEGGDVLVVAQKIVSKAEGRYVDLSTIEPSAEARTLATAVGKDPRLVEVILRQSTEVVRYRPGVLIVAHRLGLVLANAGVDQSNIEPAGEATGEDGGADRVLLLPEDPDRSASRLRAALGARFDAELGVVINDSLGRAWRQGTVGVAIGAAGIPALEDLRGAPDLFGRQLRVTEVGTGDQLAAAAALLQGQADERRPVVLVRGFCGRGPARPATSLVRAKELDLFR